MTVLANDLFTDTNGVALDSHVPTNGVSWLDTVANGNPMVIAGNKLRGNAGGYAARQARLDKGTSYPNDYSVLADLVFKTLPFDDYVYIGARSPVSGTGGYYFGYESHTEFRRFRLLKGNASSGTSLGSYAYAYPAVDTVEQIELIVASTTITCKVAGSTVITVTDSTYTAGSPSIFIAASNQPTDADSIHITSFSVNADNTANISAFVVSQIPGTASGYRLTGEALVSPTVSDSVPIPWISTDISWLATPAQVNQAIRDAAIDAAAAQGYTVGVGDNQIVISGAAE